MKIMKLMKNVLMFAISMSVMNMALAFEEGSYKGKDKFDVKYNFLVKKLDEREGSYICLLLKNNGNDQVAITTLILDPQGPSKMFGYSLALDSESRLNHNFLTPQWEIIEAGKSFTLLLKEANNSIVFKDKSDSYTWSWIVSGKYSGSRRSDELSIGMFNPSTQSVNGVDQVQAESFVLNRLMYGLFSKNIVTEEKGETVVNKSNAQMGVFLVHKGFLSRNHELHIFNDGQNSIVYKFND